MEQNQLQMDLPATFLLIISKKLKRFYIQRWEDCYDQIKWTFDHWFSDYGHKIPWPKSDPPKKNEMSRYTLPTWPTTNWPTEADFQNQVRVKDTVK